MSDDDRRILGRQQAQIVDALCAGGAVPNGVDPRAVALAAQSLYLKRARGVKRAWPGLRAASGEDFEVTFARYAAAATAPAGGHAADGRAFAEWLAAQGLLDDAGRLQLLLHRAARGWPLRVARLPAAGRLALAVRLPGPAVHWFGVRLFPRRAPQVNRGDAAAAGEPIPPRTAPP